jgi:DNA-binding NarL/FixJ family response regulator
MPRAQARPVPVVIVDHDTRVLAALRQTITLEPDLLVVGHARDAAAALNVTASSGPCVVLMEVLLPDERAGLELLRKLASQPRQVVVAMSIWGSLRRAALQAGAAAFADKDSNIDALLDAIRTAGNLIA